MVDVLIVEDEPVVAEAAARILGGAGLSVRRAVDAQAAIAELRRDSFKLVLCDLKLPGDSGFRVLEASQSLRPQAEVVMITGYATCENALESFRRGAFDFLPKPFDVDELLAAATRALRLVDRGLGAAPAEPVPLHVGGDAPGDQLGVYMLGRHSWATLDPDGSATLGLGETFSGLVGTTLEVALPSHSEHLLQCRRCAAIRGSDGLEHRVWAPLSGRVIAVNRDLEAEPNRLDSEPWTDCWLVRIVPETPAEELPRLMPF